MRQTDTIYRSLSIEDQYWIETDNYSKLLKSAKAPVQSNAEKVFPHFEKSSTFQQNTFLEKVRFQTSLFQEAIAESISIVEDIRFVWLFFKKLGLRPPADLFERLGQEDYIEVYDPSGLQLFANLEFGRIISYSIEETYWYSFEQLYKRNPIYTEQLLTEFAKCFSNASGPFTPNISDHVVHEVFSPDKRVAQVQMKLFSPVFGPDKKPAAMLGASRIKLLS